MFLKFLVGAGLYESKEEAIQREEVLGQIDQVNTNYPLRKHMRSIYNDFKGKEMTFFLQLVIPRLGACTIGSVEVNIWLQSSLAVETELKKSALV